MRHSVIAALSVLILLYVPHSTAQGCELCSIRWTPLMINPLRAGAPAAKSLRPWGPPAQASASEPAVTLSAQESISLELGKPVERELSGGQSHSYKITMNSGQYLRIVVAQRGIDVAVALFAPDSKKISEADSDPLIEGLETISVIAEAPGAYLIEVRSQEKTAKTGRYKIKVEELRAAVSERARARSLLELLKESRADIRQGIDSLLLNRERSLRQRLSAKAAAQASLLNRKHTPEQAEAAAKEIGSITTEYEELQGKMK